MNRRFKVCFYRNPYPEILFPLNISMSNINQVYPNRIYIVPVQPIVFFFVLVISASDFGDGLVVVYG